MALDVECVVDGGVNGQEALGRSGRFETLHLAFASSCWLVRILSPIVLAQALFVVSRQSHLRLCRAVGTQLVGHQHIGREALLLEQLAHQFHSRSLVAPSLYKEVENLAFVVNGAPQPKLPARNRHGQASSAGQLHPRALSEPDVILSHHPAPIVRPLPLSRLQCANSRG